MHEFEKIVFFYVHNAPMRRGMGGITLATTPFAVEYLRNPEGLKKLILVSFLKR